MNSKNLYFTIFSLILLGFISSCAENSNKCSPSYASNIEQLNEKLYDSYANVAVRENNTTSDDIITPEYFGGSYVKANKLIVMVKNGSPKGIEDIKKRLGTNSNVTFVSCTYSLQELKELNAKLKVSFAKKAALRDEIGWVAVGIRPIQNRIVVYLNNASNKNISKFKNEICNSDKIIFDQLEIEPIEIQKDTIAIDNEISTFSVTNIYLSSLYTCSTTTTAGTTLTATGSVGYRAKLNGHNGFMTASHVLPALGLTVKVNSKACGVVKGVTKGAQTEAAFVMTTNNFTPINTTNWTGTKINPTVVKYTSLINRTVVAEGGMTKKAIEGTVEDIEVAWHVQGESVSGKLDFIVNKAISVKYTNQSLSLRQGDSGCPIYDKSSKNICGCLTGKAVDKNKQKVFIFTSAEIALNSMKATVY